MRDGKTIGRPSSRAGSGKRVALARALISKPRVLLLDEPFGALDALTRLEMHELLTAVWEQQRFSTVLITHDVAEAVALADRVACFATGGFRSILRLNCRAPRRALGDSKAARLQDQILRHV